MSILHAPILEQAGFVKGALEPVEDEAFLDENGAMYATSELNENSELWSE